MWGATGGGTRFQGVQQVSIHAPVWGATLRASNATDAQARFNPRARVGRDFTATGRCFDSVFQSTRPCGARRARIRPHPKRAEVSIHAPVWGATDAGCLTSREDPFQSTRPCGARPRLLYIGFILGDVSIHAPVWGATWSLLAKSVPVGRFNPRARVGRDPPTPHSRTPGSCFNPRARVGRDADQREQGQADVVSIHAPVWGATTAGRKHATLTLFQSTRPCGARPATPHSRRPRNSFQSTRPCGARREPDSIFNAVDVVSIHAPVWGATARRLSCLISPG